MVLDVIALNTDITSGVLSVGQYSNYFSSNNFTIKATTRWSGAIQLQITSIFILKLLRERKQKKMVYIYHTIVIVQQFLTQLMSAYRWESQQMKSKNISQITLALIHYSSEQKALSNVMNVQFRIGLIIINKNIWWFKLKKWKLIVVILKIHTFRKNIILILNQQEFVYF